MMTCKCDTRCVCNMIILEIYYEIKSVFKLISKIVFIVNKDTVQYFLYYKNQITT